VGLRVRDINFLSTPCFGVKLILQTTITVLKKARKMSYSLYKLLRINRVLPKKVIKLACYPYHVCQSEVGIRCNIHITIIIIYGKSAHSVQLFLFLKLRGKIIYETSFQTGIINIFYLKMKSILWIEKKIIKN